MANLEPKRSITLFFGGKVNLGGNVHVLMKSRTSFVGLDEMAAADLRLVNLTCVIATKGEPVHFDRASLRARPEQTNILVNADTDIVLTANNHAGDYGTEALLEQRGYLDAAGINSVGSGKNFSEAFAPVYKRVGDVILAIFSVDTTTPDTAADDTSAGTAYLPPDNLELWKEIFADRIRDAHDKADVVIVAPYVEPLGTNPTDTAIALAHLLIDLGADAILGCGSQTFQAVENYKERPIIYDAGAFLLDASKRTAAGCFTLEISSDGVEKVNFIPLIKRSAQTLRAKKSAAAVNQKFVALCDEYGTETDSGGGSVAISFAPAPRESKVVNELAEGKREKILIEPLAEPYPDWTVDAVPDEAIIPPQKFGPLKLVGYRVPPECRMMTARTMLYVETYWTIDKPIDKTCILSIHAVPTRECRVYPFGIGQAHEFLDFMWPVERWTPGVIYREKFGLRPPEMRRLANVPFRMEIKVTSGKKELGSYTDPVLIKMRLPGRANHDCDVILDDAIYKSEPGKCWNAEQLAKVTGGKWLVPPPEGWYIQSFVLTTRANLPRPNLAMAGRSVSVNMLLKDPSKFDGAMVTRNVKGLPPDFPLLKVDSVAASMLKFTIAARKRFQGKVIAVTGSAGKTTTCNMLRCVLGKDHSITATPGSSNMYGAIPRIFSNVKKDDAYAIIELSIDAFEKVPGSITYEIVPNVAVITSIAPAHIGRRGSLEVIARNKRRIFNGMTPGSYAVLNRDMPCYELFEERAKSFKLNIITFGTHPDATVRMPVIAHDKDFFIDGKAYRLSCPSVPAEQLYDALGVVSVSLAVGYSVEKTLEYLQTFEPVSGRGNIIELNRNGKNLTVINSAYNANPDSMKFALQHLKNVVANPKYRVAILGDIAALGALSVGYHEGLAEAMLAAEPDRLLLCGKYMRHPYEMVKDKLNVTYFETIDDLLDGFEARLHDGDTILIKSSHDTGLSKIVDFLKEGAVQIENQPADLSDDDDDADLQNEVSDSDDDDYMNSTEADDQ